MLGKISEALPPVDGTGGSLDGEGLVHGVLTEGIDGGDLDQVHMGDVGRPSLASLHFKRL